MIVLRLEFGDAVSVRASRAGWLLLIAGAMCLALALLQHLLLSRELAATQDALARAQQALPKNSIAAVSRHAPEDFQYARQVIDRLMLPWDELFGAVERADSRRVALLKIQPDASRRELLLQGEAKDADAMLAYIRTLERTEALEKVQLTRHELQRDGVRSIRFTVLAQWKAQP